MTVLDYVEFYTLFFGWFLYDSNWYILEETGLWLLPIIGSAVTLYISSVQRDYFTKTGIVIFIKQFILTTISMIFVLIFAVMPTQEIQISEMKFIALSMECGVDDPDIIIGGETGTTNDRTFIDLMGKTAKVPIWFGFIHGVNKGVTNAAIAGIPCVDNITAFTTKLSTERIKDPALKSEVSNFYESCWQQSSAFYRRNSNNEGVQAEEDDINWIGSNYFVSRPGYYDSVYALAPVKSFGYVPLRDDVRRKAGSIPADGGYPMCEEWWSDSLKGKLLAGVEPELKDSFNNKFASWFGAETNAEKENWLIRTALEVETLSDPAGDMKKPLNYTDGDATTFLDGFLGMAGAAVDQTIGTGAGAYAMKSMLPVLHHFVVMFVVMLLPFYFVFARFTIGSVITITIILFAVEFIPFIWAVSFWAENKIFMLIASAIGSLSLNTVNLELNFYYRYLGQGMYLGAPIIWVSVIGWAGTQMGNSANQFMGGVSEKMSGGASRGGAGLGKGMSSKIGRVKTAKK